MTNFVNVKPIKDDPYTYASVAFIDGKQFGGVCKGTSRRAAIVIASSAASLREYDVRDTDDLFSVEAPA